MFRGGNGAEQIMADYSEVTEFCEGYKQFLNKCKTEREVVQEVKRQAQAAGFQDIEELYKEGKSLHFGDKVYAVKEQKAISLFVIGRENFEEGMNLICAHADSPRLDVKPQPFYEKEEMALMKTHYYGGVKKYQWATVPLALHGVIIKKDGTKIQVALGEKEDDPVFYISDLPKHLSGEQMNKSMEEGIIGESLNLVSGLLPPDTQEIQGAKEHVLSLLRAQYGITEKDFISAELEVVPAMKARDVGFDRSMIAAYGHDDKVCLYAALCAILKMENPNHTCGAFFVDKEEVGSRGNTGMHSRLMENTVALLCQMHDEKGSFLLRRALEHSKMLSADVLVAYDSNYSEAYDPYNSAKLGYGPVLAKYTGRAGKKGANDANAEYLAELRKAFDEENVIWQTGEMGKIDFGGGGTIGPFAATYGMQVAECGTALLSMHAPYELAGKLDIYETHQAYYAFYCMG